MSVNYGSKRVVVGAHYGLRDWLAQRVTGALITLFTLIVLGQVLFTSGEIGYDKWAGIFSAQWMKALTFAVILALVAVLVIWGGEGKQAAFGGAFVIDTLLRGQQKAVGFVPAMHVVGRQQLVEELNAHGVLGDPVDLIG